MKKKLFSLLFIGIMVISLMGCGKEEKKYLLGDKVSTDLVDFTIEYSKLAIAIDSDGQIQNYDENSKYKYIAPKGNVYAGITIIVKNLDRSDLKIDNNFITLKYNKKESNKLSIISSSSDLAEWENKNAIFLNSNEELTYRAFILIDSETKNLDDEYNLIVELPKSDGTKESFNYSITKASRDNAKIREISLETAIDKYPLDSTIAYFDKHKDEFNSLNNDEINTFVKSNKGDHYLKFGNNNYKNYEFRNKGVDGNLIIWPGGTGSSSFMYSVEKWSVKDNYLKISGSEYSIKKLNDKYYLLISKSNNSISGLMY